MADKLDPKTPNCARLWLLTQLERIGREKSVDAVTTLLSDKDDVVRGRPYSPRAIVPPATLKTCRHNFTG